jgi:ribonucleoside-diphosphate reductase beta chain
MEYVVKRNKTVVPFNQEKIVNAVLKAMNTINDNEKENKPLAIKIKNRVLKKLKTWDVDRPHVDQIHTLVENSLMDAKFYDVAREYITYRDANKPDIFRHRTEIKPYEYPNLAEYVDAIRGSYWTHTEFNFTGDVQDIKVNMSEKETNAAIRSMLAISQIENAVKKFWGTIDSKLPKPEISKVGSTFAESEVRHEDAYSQLLERLKLNDEFKTLSDVPCIAKRIKYLNKVNKNMKATDNRDFFETIILFSMFVENVSLFSQFFVLMAFNKYENRLKGISNAVEATSKEEILHANFGFDLIKIIKEENPDWFDDDLIEYIKKISYEAFEAEKEIIDWIFEYGDFPYLQKDTVIEYTKKRMNDSLKSIGLDDIFGVNEDAYDQFEWFEDELYGTGLVDFFYKRSIQYNKFTQSTTASDLF